MDISSLSSVYNDYAENTTTSGTKLKSQLETDMTSASDEELMDACKQFESYFLEQVFKEMKKTIPESEETSDSTTNMVDYFEDSMLQELAAQSTETNSLGLAQSLYEQMKRNTGL